ncbi:hypothetical protein DW923_12975 [Butyricicoccus sp. AM42-5AC]|nr:hypothetical protein DW923_12975 [Butyricicoccus sp. AM42-5AC]
MLHQKVRTRTQFSMRKGSGTFFIGMVLDIKHQGIGCLIGWGIWFIMFVLLLIDRHKREL